MRQDFAIATGRLRTKLIIKDTMKYLTYLVFFLSSTAALAQGNAKTQSPDTVLASTARAQVTVSDLEAELTRIPEKDRNEFLMNRQRLAKTVENILINKTLAAEARNAGLDKDPKVVAEIQNQAEKVLAKYRGLQLRKDVPDAQLTSKVREDYLINRGKFKRPAQYQIWFLQVSRVGRTDAQARQYAEDFLKQAKAGAPLEALAKQFSDEPNVDRNGGQIKPSNLDALEPSIARAIAKLRAGEFADVVEGPTAYFVVKLLELFPEKTYTFDEVKGDLLQDARAAYQSAIFENHISAIRSDPTIKIDADAMDAVRPATPELPPLNTSPAPAKTK